MSDLPEHDGATCPYPNDFCTHECVCGVPDHDCPLHPPTDDVVDLVGALQKAVAAARARRLGEHSSNPREDA